MPSLRSDGVSHRQYVFSSIFVTVVVSLALGARPRPNRKRKRFNDMSATVATLGGWKESVNFDVFFAVPLCLILDHIGERTERSIADRFGKFVIAHHAAHVQVFGHDHIEAPNNVGSNFVQVVLACVSDLVLNLGNDDLLSAPTVTSLFPARQDPLRLRQFFSVLVGVLRVGDSFASGKRSQAVNAQVNADAIVSLWQRLNSFVKAERCKVLPTTRLGYRHGSGGALEISAPTNVQSSDLGNGQAFVPGVPFEGAGSVLGGLLAPFLFECRVSTALIKKVIESLLQMSQNLLRGYARNFVQPNVIGGLLQFGQHGRRFVVIDLLALVIQICSLTERPIIHETHGPKCSGQLCLLFGRWIESKSVSYFHKNIVTLVRGFVNCQQPPYCISRR